MTARLALPAMAFALLAALPAVAQPVPAPSPAPPVPAPSPAPVVDPPADLPARQAAAERLMAATDVDAAMRQMLPQLIELMLRQLIVGNGDKEAELRAIIGDEFGTRFSKVIPLIHDKARDLYSAKFTVAELEQLIIFAESPVGRKAARLTQEIQVEMFAFGQQAGIAVAQDAMPAIIDRMKAANLSVPQKS